MFCNDYQYTQGQTWTFVGIELIQDCFSHGQLYVGASRISSSSYLVILASEGNILN